MPASVLVDLGSDATLTAAASTTPVPYPMGILGGAVILVTAGPENALGNLTVLIELDAVAYVGTVQVVDPVGATTYAVAVAGAITIPGAGVGVFRLTLMDVGGTDGQEISVTVTNGGTVTKAVGVAFEANPIYGPITPATKLNGDAATNRLYGTGGGISTAGAATHGGATPGFMQAGMTFGAEMQYIGPGERATVANPKLLGSPTLVAAPGAGAAITAVAAGAAITLAGGPAAQQQILGLTLVYTPLGEPVRTLARTVTIPKGTTAANAATIVAAGLSSMGVKVTKAGLVVTAVIYKAGDALGTLTATMTNLTVATAGAGPAAVSLTFTIAGGPDRSGRTISWSVTVDATAPVTGTLGVSAFATPTQVAVALKSQIDAKATLAATNVAGVVTVTPVGGTNLTAASISIV